MLTYDANGNRTSDGKYKYTWNEDDQIVAITKQGESNAFATYKYDEDNRRIEKNISGTVTRYFYDGDSINPLYETDGSGKVLRQYVYSTSGTRLAMKSQGQTVYYHYNPRGDVVAMTDQNREVVATYEYDAWGNVLKSEAKGIAADNPFGYAGYMYDKEIGMYYLIARYYNPEHGVFLSVDPDPGDEDDPVTQNGYTYGDNNPVMMVDPDGHSAYRPWGTTPMPYYNNRTRYAHFKGVKSGLSAVKSSYEGISGIGNGVNKLVTFSIGAAYGWKTSKNNSKNQIANLSPGQRVAKQQIIKNTVKSAVKGAFFVGSKSVGGIGFIPDMAVYIDGYYKGYKKGYTEYRPKKTNSKKRRR
ncbi:tRNA(Glu)-specific nuclease WapA precursor [Bacillus mycoides]|uniref:tRNA(Glu)-specific nuclease WapA n=1 Tax=Bacillus mycoides TaxID=1405 RepID=A0A1D3MJF0_BACMY|nr:RHS repeat-associated core domain-containing protein [Bacillus mycoides]MBJ8069583.1 RHS repeat-associated core domain-containing protein [Bacillus cereus]MBJ8187477.1 RHS repeat-associated core domain-containing protein [Bacillus cereus]OFD51130.1 tRNA(Glu)-specific nuclease WapA precursor [Bacillus mycoides]OFD62185.1 tRNA(Glu)-specific nuclease WapA precursor [Bacillus mycoides]OFD64685.1 tRNA(Glu)-specific nuclease WapA precursor [Bacillus mycoides]